MIDDFLLQSAMSWLGVPPVVHSGDMAETGAHLNAAWGALPSHLTDDPSLGFEYLAGTVFGGAFSDLQGLRSLVESWLVQPNLFLVLDDPGIHHPAERQVWGQSYAVFCEPGVYPLTHWRPEAYPNVGPIYRGFLAITVETHHWEPHGLTAVDTLKSPGRVYLWMYQGGTVTYFTLCLFHPYGSYTPNVIGSWAIAQEGVQQPWRELAVDMEPNPLAWYPFMQQLDLQIRFEVWWPDEREDLTGGYRFGEEFQKAMTAYATSERGLDRLFYTISETAVADNGMLFPNWAEEKYG